MGKKEIEADLRKVEAHIKELQTRQLKQRQFKPCEISRWLSELMSKALAQKTALQAELMKIEQQKGQIK